MRFLGLRLSGQLPFTADDEADKEHVLDQIKGGRCQFQGSTWAHVSEDGMNLVQCRFVTPLPTDNRHMDVGNVLPSPLPADRYIDRPILVKTISTKNQNLTLSEGLDRNLMHPGARTGGL